MDIPQRPLRRIIKEPQLEAEGVPWGALNRASDALLASGVSREEVAYELRVLADMVEAGR